MPDPTTPAIHAHLRSLSDAGGDRMRSAQKSAGDQFQVGADALYAWGTARSVSDIMKMQSEFARSTMHFMTAFWAAAAGQQTTPSPEEQAGDRS
ncbi:hypothetical protein [Salipiger mucosus]|uniref:Phasin domain-containing protein n=1 Tax=Salipiger mucosus DSM 16094 TaxID=1123237 RepID=S9QWA9_9RHOB|nr:hypothetical protein [Salipiger mucosus]EPX83903.1 hypothetical protein Salmuc_01678 [Salipiger mucosus DSM 16094]